MVLSLIFEYKKQLLTINKLKIEQYENDILNI